MVAFSPWCPGPFCFEQEEKVAFSLRRRRYFPHYVLKLWALSKRRRHPKLCVVLELRVSTRRRRWPFPRALLELWVLRVLSRRRHV
jgi:hypothetical protein